MRLSLTKVPLVEPRSCTDTESAVTNSRACLREGLPSTSFRSLSALRPTDRSTVSAISGPLGSFLSLNFLSAIVPSDRLLTAGAYVPSDDHYGGREQHASQGGNPSHDRAIEPGESRLQPAHGARAVLHDYHAGVVAPALGQCPVEQLLRRLLRS